MLREHVCEVRGGDAPNRSQHTGASPPRLPWFPEPSPRSCLLVAMNTAPPVAAGAEMGRTTCPAKR